MPRRGTRVDHHHLDEDGHVLVLLHNPEPRGRRHEAKKHQLPVSAARRGEVSEAGLFGVFVDFIGPGESDPGTRPILSHFVQWDLRGLDRQRLALLVRRDSKVGAGIRPPQIRRWPPLNQRRVMRPQPLLQRT